MPENLYLGLCSLTKKGHEQKPYVCMMATTKIIQRGISDYETIIEFSEQIKMLDSLKLNEIKRIGWKHEATIARDVCFFHKPPCLDDDGNDYELSLKSNQYFISADEYKS